MIVLASLALLLLITNYSLLIFLFSRRNSVLYSFARSGGKIAMQQRRKHAA